LHPGRLGFEQSVQHLRGGRVRVDRVTQTGYLEIQFTGHGFLLISDFRFQIYDLDSSMVYLVN
jgi:hypothetical protein